MNQDVGKSRAQGECSLETGSAYVLRRASVEDVPGIAKLLAQARERAAEQSMQLLQFERDAEAAHTEFEEEKRGIEATDQAFFVAGPRDEEPTVVLQCRHMEGVPPVYNPGRSVLVLQGFHSEADEVALVGSKLVDEAVRWSKGLSQKGSLFVTSVTWNHEDSRQEVLQQFHTTSALQSDPSYRELFTIGDEAARMKPAAHWYFQESKEMLQALQHGSSSGVTVRRAEEADIEAMVQLSKLKRHDYARYQPVFWRPAEDAEQKQVGFFSWLIQHPQNALFVSQEADGTLNGFIIALPRERLPMLDSALTMRNGLHIDDFAVKSDALWDTARRVLLASAVEAHEKHTGKSAVINVVSGAHDIDKRRFLSEEAGMRSLYSWDILPSGNLFGRQGGK